MFILSTRAVISGGVVSISSVSEPSGPILVTLRMPCAACTTTMSWESTIPLSCSRSFCTSNSWSSSEYQSCLLRQTMTLFSIFLSQEIDRNSKSFSGPSMTKSTISADAAPNLASSSVSFPPASASPGVSTSFTLSPPGRSICLKVLVVPPATLVSKISWPARAFKTEDLPDETVPTAAISRTVFSSLNWMRREPSSMALLKSPSFPDCLEIFLASFRFFWISASFFFSGMEDREAEAFFLFLAFFRVFLNTTRKAHNRAPARRNSPRPTAARYRYPHSSPWASAASYCSKKRPGKVKSI